MLGGRRAAVLGDINLDIIAFHQSFPVEGGEELAERALIRHGGSGANIAHTLAKLGANTLMLGCVGRDIIGSMLIKGLAAAGVDTSNIQQTEKEPSGIVYVVITGAGERTMLAYRGANKYLRYNELQRELLNDVDVLHLSGYSLLEGEQRNTALKLLGERGSYLLTLDMCVPLARSLNSLEIISGRIDCLFVNSYEFGALSHQTGVKTVSELASRLGCMVVLKKGVGGCEVSSVDGDVIEVPAAPVKPVDTTGAGDAFTAGFIYELMAGAPPAKCAQRAVTLGALASTTIGGRLDKLNSQ